MSCDNSSLFVNLQLNVIVMIIDVTMDSVFGTHSIVSDVIALCNVMMAVMKKTVHAGMMIIDVTMDSVFGTHLVIDSVMALKTVMMAVMKKAVVSLMQFVIIMTSSAHPLGVRSQ